MSSMVPVLENSQDFFRLYQIIVMLDPLSFLVAKGILKEVVKKKGRKYELG